MDIIIILLVVLASLSLFKTKGNNHSNHNNHNNHENHDNNETGQKYENVIKKKLENIFKIPIYSNILVKNSETDMCFVTNKGIFVTECKYRYAGPTLYVRHCDGSASFLNAEDTGNPLSQNIRHIEVMSEVLSIPKDILFNIIITTARVEYKFLGRTLTTKDNGLINKLKGMRLAFVTYNDGKTLIEEKIDGMPLFKEAVDKLPDILSDEEVEKYREIISSYQISEEEMIAFKKRFK